MNAVKIERLAEMVVEMLDGEAHDPFTKQLLALAKEVQGADGGGGGRTQPPHR